MLQDAAGFGIEGTTRDISEYHYTRRTAWWLSEYLFGQQHLRFYPHACRQQPV